MEELEAHLVLSHELFHFRVEVRSSQNMRLILAQRACCHACFCGDWPRIYE